MPVDSSKYPKDWKQISEAIKANHGWKCGFCGVSDKEIVKKLGGGKYMYSYRS
jgi:hypothetical protein